MSGHGSPSINVNAAGMKAVIVAASWHETVMNGLLDGARRGLADAGIAESDVTVVRVPGTFELTAACARLAAKFDVVVALGVVIRGGTPHFDYVCNAATNGITDICVTTGKPIGFGVLTCDNDEQALDRAGLPGSSEDKGHEAATAAVAAELALREAGV